MLSRLSLLVVLAASPTLARDAPSQDGSLLPEVEACLASAGDSPDSCIRKAANRCMEGPDGGTTFGSAGCLTAEQEAWDAILNRNYQASMREAEEKDRALADTYTPDVASSLKTAQRAWIAYRDAECERVYAFWKDGTIRTPASADCLLDLTARRAIELAPAGS